jgi:hypothetical protein
VSATVPCGSCPWRRSNPAGGERIPGFGLELMRGLSCTVGDSDDFRTVMACHGSPEGGEEPCVGYVAREGYRNLNVRLMAATGRLDLRAIVDDCAPLDLWASFGEMLEAYEAAFDGSKQ